MDRYPGKIEKVDQKKINVNRAKEPAMANEFTQEELQEALRAIDSLLSKCEKAQENLIPGKSQHSLMKNRIKALRISSELIAKALSQ